jgi:TM2 domain-containing membrane protein YozV
MSQDPIAAIRATLTFDQQTQFDKLFARREKKVGVATLLSMPLLGTFGVEQFYLGNVGSGIVRLIFFWTLVPTFSALFDAAGGGLRKQVAHANLRVATKIWKQVSKSQDSTAAGVITPAAVAEAAAMAEAASPAPPPVLEAVTIVEQSTPDGGTVTVVEEQIVTSDSTSAAAQPDESLLVSTIVSESIPDETAAVRGDAALAADAQPLTGTPQEEEGILILEVDQPLDDAETSASAAEPAMDQPPASPETAAVVPEPSQPENSPEQASESASPVVSLQIEVSTLLPDTPSDAPSAATAPETHLDVSSLTETPAAIPSGGGSSDSGSTAAPTSDGGTNAPSGGVGSGGDSGSASGGLGSSAPANPPDEPVGGRPPGEPLPE